jgi:predicted MFS family arabinose efflux permease
MIRKSRITRPVAALFLAEVVSTTGSEIAAVALPWFVLVTTGSPARMGVVMAAEFAGMALLGIPSGRAATALGPRQTMLVSDLVSAPLVAVIPALHWAGVLSFPVIVAVGFAVGAFFPAYQASQQLVLTQLVGEDQVRLTRASALLGSVNETASFVGPAVGGVLVALLGPAATLVIDAGSYLAAFVLVALFVPGTAATAEEEGERGALEGLRFLRRDRRLLRTVVGIGVVEIGMTALFATLPVVARRRFHASARLAGWLLASYGAGSVAGGLISSRARSASERTPAFAMMAMAATTWPLLAPVPAWAVGLAIAANGVCSGLFFPRFFADLTVRTPPRLRARVMASATTAMSATGPLGFVGAGFLLQRSASALPGFALVAAATTLGAAIVTVSGFQHSPTAPGR